MHWHVEIRDRQGIFDAVGSGIEKDIRDLGIDRVEKVHFLQVYIIEGEISKKEVRLIAGELLADKVSHTYSLTPRTYDLRQYHTVEVAYNPGVMDPVEESALKGIRDLGFDAVKSVKTARKYIIKGRLSERELNTICEKLLYNKLIQHIVKPAAAGGTQSGEAGYSFDLISVDLLGASQERLKRISRSGQLFLNLAEMRQIKSYFRKLKRNPTDCELETPA